MSLYFTSGVVTDLLGKLEFEIGILPVFLLPLQQIPVTSPARIHSPSTTFQLLSSSLLHFLKQLDKTNPSNRAYIINTTNESWSEKKANGKILI